MSAGLPGRLHRIATLATAARDSSPSNASERSRPPESVLSKAWKFRVTRRRLVERHQRRPWTPDAFFYRTDWSLALGYEDLLRRWAKRYADRHGCMLMTPTVAVFVSGPLPPEFDRFEVTLRADFVEMPSVVFVEIDGRE